MSQHGARGLFIAIPLLIAACGVTKPGLGPRDAADLVTLLATNAPGEPCSPAAFPANFAFATRIDRSGVRTPFTVPTGKVLDRKSVV